MSGYWAIGRLNRATPPISTMTMASTLASTGRSMKNLEIMAAGRVLFLGGRGSGRVGWRGDRHQLGHDLVAGDGLPVGADDDLVVGRQALLDHAQIADQQLARNDAPLLDDIVLVDDQQVAAGLVLGNGAIGDDQRFFLF